MAKDRRINNCIYIKHVHAGVGDEVADVVTLPIKNYTGNALADEMNKQLGAHVDVICDADTLQIEITNTKQESFNMGYCLKVSPQLAHMIEISLKRLILL